MSTPGREPRSVAASSIMNQSKSSKTSRELAFASQTRITLELAIFQLAYFQYYRPTTDSDQMLHNNAGQRVGPTIHFCAKYAYNKSKMADSHHFKNR